MVLQMIFSQAAILRAISTLLPRSNTILLLTLLVLISLAPWLLDRLLRLLYGLQPLSVDTLSTYSPETIQVLQSYCLERRWPLPHLGLLPTSAPMALTYGNLPCTARIVVSQGLLEQLADDEIATIYASQLGHIAHWDFVIMSLVILVTQLPYTVYWQVSQWGDRISNSMLKSGVALIASLAYGVWWLLNGSAMWLSQLRIYYSDRLAAEITGNPNGLTRGLIKIAIGIAQDIEKQGQTSPLLESLNILAPVSQQQAISLGSLPKCTQFESVLTWDCLNPYRYWLVINNTHPLIGDRLQRLARITRQWHLETELNLASPSSHRPISYKSSPFLTSCSFFGIPLSFAFGGLYWLIWQIGFMLEFWQLKWIYDDWLFIKGCLIIGFSIGTLVRINFFFPDIKTSTVATDMGLPQLLTNPTALPVNTQPVRLQGKLLGRRGISNWLGQDLILHSPSGLIKLHCQSLLGPIGNFLPSQSPRSSDFVSRQNIVATGWFRRGATLWIDVDTLRTQGGTVSRNGHPAWSTLLASAASIWEHTSSGEADEHLSNNSYKLQPLEETLRLLPSQNMLVEISLLNYVSKAVIL
jgi:Zn-dependent protease with chaperone function